LVSDALAKEASRICQACLTTDAKAEDEPALDITEEGRLSWTGIAVAELTRGETVLRPGVRLLGNDLEDVDRRRVVAALETWSKARIAQDMKPLLALEQKSGLSGPARGLVFQLQESFGNLPRQGLEELISSLTRPDRQALRRAGVKIGAWSVFVPALQKARRAALCGLLWNVFQQPESPVLSLPAGRVSLPLDPSVPLDWYAACGYRPFGGLVVRVDIIERLADLLRTFENTPFAMSPDMLSLPGCSREAMLPILEGLGYVMAEAAADGTAMFRRPSLNERKRLARKTERKAQKARSSKKTTGQRPRNKPAAKINEDSPFAVLRDMLNG
jgi:ATP-dependent RNA helicase SUPV3L1/SUV3